MKEMNMPELDKNSPPAPQCSLFDHVMTIALTTLVAILLAMLVLSVLVERRIPAGHVRSVTLGGYSPKSLVETETGFYPLYGVARFERGAPVALEQRRDGGWVLCGPDESTCIPTSDTAWQQAPLVAAP